MKKLLPLILIVCYIPGWTQSKISPHVCSDAGMLGSRYDDAILKLVDFSYRYVINSAYKNNAEVLYYPITAHGKRGFPLDPGLGGGISFTDFSSYLYAKLYLAKELIPRYKSFAFASLYRMGVGGFADFIPGNKSIRAGFDIINTFYITRSLKTRILIGPSYHTLEKSWKFHLGISLAFEDYFESAKVKKPVIYAYANDTTDVEIKLNFDGHLTFTYPTLNESWNVKVCPDGSVIDQKTLKSYPYLFWEGDYDLTSLAETNKGFVVSQHDLIPFLEDRLNEIGLNSREITDFITFWVPQLNEDQYLIRFYQQENCDALATYEVDPTPDNFLRLYVTFQPYSGNKIGNQPVLNNINRTGFTLVEWGGMILPEKVSP